jgi:hypothetical protein
MADFSCTLSKRTSHWPAPMWREESRQFRISILVAALVLTGCNANQVILTRKASDVVAHWYRRGSTTRIAPGLTNS